MNNNNLFSTNLFISTETKPRTKHRNHYRNAKSQITKWSIEQSVSNGALDTGHLPRGIEKATCHNDLWKERSNKLLNRADCSRMKTRQTVWLSDRCTNSIRNPNKGEKPSTCLSFFIIFLFPETLPRACRSIACLNAVSWSSLCFDSIRVIHGRGIALEGWLQ